jgi:predicted esterase
VHVTEEIDTDPMLGDVEDPSSLQRRCLLLGPLPGCAPFLPSSVPVFARVVGDPSNPLVLYVHGSGPRNSSMFWNDVVTAVDALHPDLYHVAIDCPGYGRSGGDRQCIRSYPGALIEGIIRACGKRSAAALVGSSQGACSVLNALLERPQLAEAVAVVHPVGHAVERYTAISQPALLIFNTEDPGHPVEVGRRMRDHLPDPTYLEFTESKHGLWDQQHIAPELVKLLRKAQGKRRGGAGKKGRVELPELSVLAGGLGAWSERFGDEHGWARVDGDEQLGMADLISAPGITGGAVVPVLLPGQQMQLPGADMREAFFSDEESDEAEEDAAAAGVECFDHLAICCSDIGAAFAHIVEGSLAPVILEPCDMFGTKIMGLEDPNGYKVYLVEEGSFRAGGVGGSGD